MKPDDAPMTWNEFLEMRAKFQMEVRKLGVFTLQSLMRLPPKSPCFNRKLSEREAEYLEIASSSVDEVF